MFICCKWYFTKIIRTRNNIVSITLCKEHIKYIIRVSEGDIIKKKQGGIECTRSASFIEGKQGIYTHLSLKEALFAYIVIQH